jgi:hypothetical protein
VKLKQAPPVVIPPPACWQRYAGRFLGGYLLDFGRAGHDLERSKVLCSRNAQCGGVTRQFDVHGGMLWTLRASADPNALPDTHGCLHDTCESWVYLRQETSEDCRTHDQEPDRTGVAKVMITVSDGTHDTSTEFRIHVVPAPFRLHSRISVFAAAPGEVSTVENASFGLWRPPCVVVPRVAGRSVFAAENADGQLKCTGGATADNVRSCRCQPYPDTPQRFVVAIENENLSQNPTMTTMGTLLLPASDVPFLSGITSIQVTLIDGADVPYQANSTLDFRLVNQAPTFSSRSITIAENENCRAQEGWDILNTNVSSAAPVACRHSISNVTWDLSAGPFPELCANCGLGQASCDSLPPGIACVQQRVTFRVEHVSDATMFQTHPHLSVDGVLTFSLWPEVSGELQIALRLIDDGGYNGAPNPELEWDDAFDRQCSTTRLVPCGPAAGPAQRVQDNGTDVSELVFVNIRILNVNQKPSMVLDRQVSCVQANIDACKCPGLASAFQQDSLCAANGHELASITVLENSGLHHVHAFVRQISAGGGVPNEMAIFAFEEEYVINSTIPTIRTDPPGESNITFELMRPDPHGALKGLEASVDFAASPDGAHAYVAELESSTLAVLDYRKGEEGIRLLDRLTDGENRVRFHDSKAFATDNPCSATVAELQNQTFLALMQGCEVLVQNMEHFPSYREGDAYASDSKSEEYGYLGPHTIGYWRFSSLWMRGLYYKPKQDLEAGYPCSSGKTTTHMTYINPGAVIDISGTFPPAYMDTDQCRSNSYQDTVPGEQPTLLTYMMNDGVNEVLNFDGKLLQALWISRDVAALEHLFPKQQISVEVWFSIEFALVVDPETGEFEPPIDPHTDVAVDNGGLLAASDRFTGWDLYYSLLSATTVTINWAISLEGTVDPPPTEFKLAIATINNFQYRTWYHVVATYDGIRSSVYVNGEQLATQQTCATGNSAPCRMRMPRHADDREPGAFIIGAGSMESSSFKSHFGQIASIRILDRAMNGDEVLAGYNLRKDSLQNTIPVDTYWTKAYGGGLLPSPSAFHADSADGKVISLMGRFHMERNYTCRWAHLDKFADSYATSNFAVALDSNDPTSPIRLCDTGVDGQCEVQRYWCLNSGQCQPQRHWCPNSCQPPEEDLSAYEKLEYGEKLYHNQLTCDTPHWNYGYKAAILSVIEEGDENGRRVLWQRTCVRPDTCSYVDYQKLPDYFSPFTSHRIMKKRQLWYLSGQSSANFRGVNLQLKHSFGQNRGDFTYFTFTVNSFLQPLDDGGAFMRPTLPLSTDFVLGASKVEFFEVTGSNETLMAVANYWDGLSTHTNSIVARLDLNLSAEAPAVLQNSATMLQSIPTQGATGFAHIVLTSRDENLISKSFDYLAVSNYGGKTKIYRWSTAQSILAINIARRGSGYIPGIIRILSAEGTGFDGFISTSHLQLFKAEDTDNAAYNFSGGQLVCNTSAGFECARIASHGSGFVPELSLPTSVADSQLAHFDLKCTVTGCNPLTKDVNCSISQDPVCNSLKVRGHVDVYYGAGCADDDAGCSETRMSDSITTVTVLRGQTELPKGHTSKCFRPGIVFHNNSKQENSTSLRVDYNVDFPTGSIVSVNFPDAASHGSMYYRDPPITLNDDVCRCGTTVTSIKVMWGGQGYTSGTMTMSGSPTKQAPASGSGFFAHFLAKGNVTEIQVLDSAIGFTSPPRVRIANDDLKNPAGKNGAGAHAVAVLKLHSILLLTPGSTYLHQPTVIIDEPKAAGGRRAEAEAVMELVVNTTSITRYRLAEIIVTEPGFGYTSLPRIFVVEHPDEEPSMRDYHPTAMAVLQVDKVIVNHDYSKYA